MCYNMKLSRIVIFELGLGLILVVAGFFLWCWSMDLFWIMIYPPPLEKRLIETIILMVWAVGAVFVIDGLRRFIKNK